MSYVEEIDRLTEQLAQVTAHRDGLRIVAAHEQVRRETAEAQRDRALAVIEQVRAAAKRGTGTDITPTTREFESQAWWYGYLGDLDLRWRETILGILPRDAS